MPAVKDKNFLAGITAIQFQTLREALPHLIGIEFQVVLEIVQQFCHLLLEKRIQFQLPQSLLDTAVIQLRDPILEKSVIQHDGEMGNQFFVVISLGTDGIHVATTSQEPPDEPDERHCIDMHQVAHAFSESIRHLVIHKLRAFSGLSLERGPTTLAFVYQSDILPVVLYELGQSRSRGIRHKFLHQPSVVIDGSFDVVEHIALGLPLHVDGATTWQKGESQCDLVGNTFVFSGTQGTETAGEIILLVHLCHEVEHGEVILPHAQSQSSSQLLQEDGKALRRTEEQGGIYLWNINAFVEDIHDTEIVDFSGSQISVHPHTFLNWRIGRKACSPESRLSELNSHIVGVFPVGAEAKRMALGFIGQIFLQFLHDKSHTLFVAKPVGKSGDDVLAVRPKIIAGDVRVIGDAEILERSEQSLVEGLWKPDFRTDFPSEVRKQTLLIHSLRCSGKTQEDMWFEVVHDESIAHGSGMMGFIDDDKVVIAGSQSFEYIYPLVEGSNRDKQMLDIFFWSIVSYPKFTEVGIPQHTSEGMYRLLQDFLSVSDKEQFVFLSRMTVSVSLIIKSGDDGLACSRSSDHEISA